MLQSKNHPTNGLKSFDDWIREEFQSLQMTSTMIPSRDRMRSILNTIESTEDWQIDFWQFQTFIRQSIDSIWNQQLNPHEKTILEIALFCRIIRTASHNGVDKWFYNKFLPNIDDIVSTLKTKLASSDSEWFKNIWNSLLDTEIPIWNSENAQWDYRDQLAPKIHDILGTLGRIERLIWEVRSALIRFIPKKKK